MAMKFTPAQQSAISCRDKTLLVSAAAGSGKTATLTQRIIESLTDEENPLDITKMLIVTFTRAAASDLKTKISRALSTALAMNPSDRRLSKQLMLIGSAKISTIDAFYIDIVRSNCQTLNFPDKKLSLSPDFRIADNDEIAILSLNTMNSLIEDYYNKVEKTDYDFANFVDNFTDAKNDKELADVLISLHRNIQSLSNSETFLSEIIEKLKEAQNQSLYETFFGKILKNDLLEKYSYFKTVFDSACENLAENENAAKAYLSAFENDKLFCDNVCEYLSGDNCNVSELRELFAQHSIQGLGRLKAEYKDEDTEMYQALRDDFKKEFKKEISESFGFDDEQTKELTKKTCQIVEKIDEILKDYDSRILKEKLSRKIADFPDIRRYTKQILLNKDGSPSEIALMYRNNFDSIYIDEYQDVDEVQDQIFRAIARPNNLFMVGDIKQSIYAFRGAQAIIFTQLRKKFPLLSDATVKNADGRTVFMSNNFRSDENIIKFTNAICSSILSKCKDTVDYKPEDDLIFSKSIENSEYKSQKVTLCMIGYDNSEHKKEINAMLDETDFSSDTEDDFTDEAIYISNEISSLLKQKKADNTPIEPQDIAIMVRTKKEAKPLEAALTATGIPVLNNVVVGYFENPEVLLVTSLLSTIDNPYKDIHLTATLRSPLFGFTFDDLIIIRSCADSSYSLYEACEIYSKQEGARHKIVEKCKYFFKKLDEFRKLSQSLPVDKLIRHLYDDLFILAYAGGDKARNATYEQKRSNLLRLYEYARRFETGSFRGLHNFIGYLSSILSEKIEIKSDNSESKNAVTIITIHQSKGLEFPVCFICNVAKLFNKSFLKQSLIFEQNLGIGIKTHDNSGWARIDTPLRRAVKQKIITANSEEEMRILYVALTRAREKLYLTAKLNGYIDNVVLKAKHAALFDCRYKAIDSNSYLSWILTATEKVNCDGFLDIIRIAPNSTFNKLEEEDKEQSGLSETEVSDVYELVKKRFDFVYPYEHATMIPAKLSVSKLYPSVLDKDDEYATELKEGDELDLPSLAEKPDFYTHSKAVTAADKGTATHTFLQFCNFDYVENNGVNDEIIRLLSGGFIDKKYAKIINVKQIEDFFRSDFYKQIKQSSFVRREQRFNLLLPANKFTRDEKFAKELANDTLTVQGVIDLFFEDKDKNIVLCDYKTDYITADEFRNPKLAAQKLSERHRQQLTYYAAAIEQLCGKFPTKTVIYSLPLAGIVEVDIEKL